MLATLQKFQCDAISRSMEGITLRFLHHAPTLCRLARTGKRTQNARRGHLDVRSRALRVTGSPHFCCIAPHWDHRGTTKMHDSRQWGNHVCSSVLPGGPPLSRSYLPTFSSLPRNHARHCMQLGGIQLDDSGILLEPHSIKLLSSLPSAATVTC